MGGSGVSVAGSIAVRGERSRIRNIEVMFREKNNIMNHIPVPESATISTFSLLSKGSCHSLNTYTPSTTPFSLRNIRQPSPVPRIPQQEGIKPGQVKEDCLVLQEFFGMVSQTRTFRDFRQPATQEDFLNRIRPHAYSTRRQNDGRKKERDRQVIH